MTSKLWCAALFICLMAESLFGATFHKKPKADLFRFDPPPSFTLTPSFIVSKHPVSTNKIEAQLYFDQGLSLLYAVNSEAAYWSFLQASQADPELAMAYWGMALALGPNINMNTTDNRVTKAYELIQKALQLSLNLPPSEKDYIQALSQRYSNAPDRNFDQLTVNYSNAMREVAKKYPDDLDAATLFAESILNINPWSNWSWDGKPKEGVEEAVAQLESVLKRDPDHLGANHYYIHAIEASKFPEKALAVANRLGKLMPASGHILHMPSHIYILVGDYKKAADCNEEAAAVDREYIRQYGIQGIYPVHYLSHNLYFLSRAYAMEGRFADAKRAANELEELYIPHAEMMPELEYYASPTLFVLMRFHQWKEVLQISKPDPKLPMSTALWHFCRAMAYIRLGDLKKGEEERNLFLESKERIDPEVLFGYNKAATVIKIPENLLDAAVEESKGNISKAIDYFQKAIDEQDHLAYNEPPDWYFPVRESLGGLLLRNQGFKEAEEAFRKDLAQHPRNGRSLFGLMKSLEAQNRLSDAHWVDTEFQKAWLYSDNQLTIDAL